MIHLYRHGWCIHGNYLLCHRQGVLGLVGGIFVYPFQQLRSTNRLSELLAWCGLVSERIGVGFRSWRKRKVSVMSLAFFKKKVFFLIL